MTKKRTVIIISIIIANVILLGLILWASETLQENQPNVCNHTVDSDWICDNKYHYHTCTNNGCEEIFDYARHVYDSNKTCTSCQYVTQELLGTELSTDVYQVNGNDLYVKVNHSCDLYDFKNTFEIAEDASYQIFADEDCTVLVTDNESTVNTGGNHFYLLITNNADEAVYEINVYKLSLYSVSFNTNSDSSITTQNIEENSLVTAPITTVEKPGYIFEGWDYDFSTPVSDNTTINAIWSIIDYDITYELDGGTNDVLNSPTYNVESSFSFATPEKAGYTFNGWYGDVEKTTAITGVNPGDTEDLTVYADWTPTTYTITYNNNGGTTPQNNATSYTIEDSVTLQDATREHYDFNGWFADEEFTTKIEDIPLGSMGPLTLYACWTPINYTITKYFEDTQLPSETFTVEDLPFAVSAGYTTGWTFKTWHSDANLSSSNVTTLTAPKDTTVYGKFVEGSEGVSYELNSDSTGYVVTGYTHPDVTLVIPDFYEGLPVVSINSNAIFNNRYIREVVFGDELVSIGYKAFYGCFDLHKVTLGKKLTSVGGTAFGWCGIMEIINKSNLAPTSSIEGHGRLWYFPNITVTLTEEDNVNRFITDEDGYCTYTHNDKVYFIDYYGEDGDVVIPNNVTDVLPFALYFAPEVTSITIPDSVKVINEYAFENCRNATDVTIGKNVEFIGYAAFGNMQSLKNITFLGNKIETLKGNIFRSVSTIENVYFNGTLNDWLQLPFYNYNDNPLKTNANLYLNGQLLDATNLTIDGSFATINGYTLIGLNIKELVLSEGVTTISGNAFSGCTSLTKIVLPTSLTTISKGAFNPCTSLTEVYYLGNDTSGITVGSNNTYYESATKYYYVENQEDLPDDDGNYWHFVNGVITVWSKED